MKDYLIDQRNSNRYRVMVKESLGYTAYCFSTPIYSAYTRSLIKLTVDMFSKELTVRFRFFKIGVFLKIGMEKLFLF